MPSFTGWKPSALLTSVSFSLIGSHLVKSIRILCFSSHFSCSVRNKGKTENEKHFNCGVLFAWNMQAQENLSLPALPGFSEGLHCIRTCMFSLSSVCIDRLSQLPPLWSCHYEFGLGTLRSDMSLIAQGVVPH